MAGGAWIEQVIHNFGGAGDGWKPEGIVIGGRGVLYGTSQEGGASGHGTVYSLKPPASPADPWTETLLIALRAPGATEPDPPRLL